MSSSTRADHSGSSIHSGDHSSLANKPLPAFEVSSHYDKYKEQTEDIYLNEETSDIDDDVFDEDELLADFEDDEFTEETEAEEEPQEQPEPELTLEEKTDRVLTCVGSQNALREALYKTLVFCQEPREFGEVENYIADTDEFKYSHIIQSPYTMIQMLTRAYGLEQIPLDADGNVITDEQTEGLSQDEIDDLISTYEVETTEAGRAVINIMDPKKRFASQLAQKPHRAETFYRLMEFCEVPRKFPEIQEFFKNTPGLAIDTVQVHHKLSPDFYVDKLDKAGILVWQKAWILTDAGKEALNDWREQNSTFDNETD
ncbi:MAG: hypothetical protein LUB61_01530 [Eggerthellaceae bacterium]|nr:hypothetical protein [Eggerthellaceae bacterium]